MTNLKSEIVNKKLEETLSLKSSLPLSGGPKKLAPLDKSMLPYEHRRNLLEQKAIADQKKEEALLFELRMTAKDEERRKLEENREFMTDWLAEGKRSWKQNQKRRAEAIAKVQYFEDREVKAYKDKLGRELDEATRELMGGIEEFDRNL